MIQEIASFVDPDPTVEFDPASRVSRHASLKYASLLSSLVMPLSYSLCAFLFLPRVYTHRRSRSLDQNKRSNWTSLEREAKGKQEGEERKRRNESRGKEEPSVAGGTKRGVEDGVKEEGGRGGRAAKEKGRATRGATKVAVTLYKASKANERGPKGKKTRRSALRGDAEGNGGVHEEEARMDGRRRWQGCKLEAVVPCRTTVHVSYSRRSFVEIDSHVKIES